MTEPEYRGMTFEYDFSMISMIIIMSRTTHFPLGFSPKVKKNGKEVEENQFLNVGLGAHPEVIVAFLADNGISFRLSDY